MSIQVSKLHTTELGEMRIRRNLALATDDVVSWCQDAVLTFGSDESRVERRGKNWYVDCDGLC